MRQSKRKTSFLLFLIGLTIILGGVYIYYQKNASPENREPLALVATTIYPLFDMVRQVSNNQVQVVNILPPGASPHLFEFSPQNLSKLRGVKIIFSIGHGLDDWALPIKNSLKDVRIVPVDHGIKLRTFPDGSVDPHYWLGLTEAQTIAKNIAEGLSEIDEAHRTDYLRHAQSYAQKLADTEKHLKELLKPVKNQPFLTFHDAWSYFARDLGLHIAGTFEPSAGNDPTIKYLTDLQQKIAREHIRVIFVEPQLSTQVLNSFAKDNHLAIGELDPLGGVFGRETYVDLANYNAQVILKALETKSP